MEVDDSAEDDDDEDKEDEKDEQDDFKIAIDNEEEFDKLVHLIDNASEPALLIDDET